MPADLEKKFPLNEEMADSALPSLTDFGASRRGYPIEVIDEGNSGREVFFAAASLAEAVL